MARLALRVSYSQSKSDPSLYCVKEVGHVGRHKYRPLGFEELVN
jgi:hypothetical protein